MNKCFALAFVVLIAFLSTVGSQALDRAGVWKRYSEGEASFRQANELLRTDPTTARNLLQKAASCFEAIQREGGIENGRLFYNIGNIYFRLGDMGRAILNYRRAERFIPNDTNLQQNLTFARSRCIDKIEPIPRARILRTVFFWHYDLGGVTRSWLFAAVFCLLWLFVAMHLLTKRHWSRYAAIGCALLSISFGCSIAVEAYEQSNILSGVVLESEVVGRKGDSVTFEPTFKEPLHAGLEFNLVEDRKGWLHIELADGRRCWIPSSSAELL